MIGCTPPEVDEWRCVGPLVELVTWRDGRERERLWGGDTVTPGELAALEASHVADAVASLRPRRARCEMTWSIVMHQVPDNPGLRLREEAILQVLGLPPRDYEPQAVGWAGQTAGGRTAVQK